MAALLVRPMEGEPVAAPTPAPVVAPEPPVQTSPEPPSEPALDPGIGKGSATVTAVFHDEQGQLVPCGANLWRVLGEGRRAMGEGSFQQCVQGAVRWEGLPAGSWRLIASGQGLALFDRTFELGDHEVLDLGVQVMVPGGRVLGVITDNGAPVSAAQVRSSDGQFVRTDAEGRYRLDGVPVGKLKVEVSTGRMFGKGEVEVLRGQASTLDLSLMPQAARGVVGLRISTVDGAVVVDAVAAGGPADGLIAVGDRLLSVDGKELGGDTGLARVLMAGEPGQPLVLERQRGEEKASVTLVRAQASEL